MLLAACASDSDGEHPVVPSPPATAEPGPIRIAAGAPVRIGLSVALEGGQGELGRDLGGAAAIAVTDFGGALDGHPIELLPRDDGCGDPERAAAVAEEFIALDDLAGVLGPMCAPGAQAANPLYQQAGIVHISPTSTRDELSEEGDAYFFRLAWRDDVQARVQADFAFDEIGARTALLVDNGEAYGAELAASFEERFTERGGGIVARERVARGTTDFSSIVREAVDLNPAVVVYQGLNPEGPLLLAALRTAQYDGAFIGPDGLLSGRDFIGVAADKSDGAIVTGGAVPDATFVERYVGIYQRLPSTPFVVQAYDATTALLKALDAVAEPGSDGSLTIDRKGLADALRAQRFAGLTGSVGFDERGDRRGETASELGIVVYRVTGAAFTPVE